MPTFKYQHPAGPAGTIPDVSTLTLEERGDGTQHVTILTLTAFALPAVAGGAAAESGAIIYTFPAGGHKIHSIRDQITSISGMEATTDADSEYGLGTVVGSAAAATLAGTDEDILAAVDNNLAMTAGVITATDVVTHTEVVSAASAVKNVCLNIAGTWAAGAATPLITGRIVLNWVAL